MHEPYERIIPGAQNAVLFIHGILSTPRFWDEYLEAIPPDWSAVCLLLPGHGGSVTDFGRVHRGEWLRCVEEAIARLEAAHERLYLVGHSMGSLLSILAASHRPERIAGMLLMAVPLRIRVKPTAFLHNMLKGVGLAESREELARYYGVAQDWRVWRYIPWIPRYLELFALSRRTRETLPRLTTPARAFQHGQDELVSPRSGRLLADCPAVTLEWLEESMHHNIALADRERLKTALRDMCGN